MMKRMLQRWKDMERWSDKRRSPVILQSVLPQMMLMLQGYCSQEHYNPLRGCVVAKKTSSKKAVVVESDNCGPRPRDVPSPSTPPTRLGTVKEQRELDAMIHARVAPDGSMRLPMTQDYANMKLPNPISCRSSPPKKHFSISPTQRMFEVDGPRVQGDGLPQEPDLALAATIQVAMSANRSVSSPWASPMVVLQ